METLEKFVKRYNAAQDRAAWQNDNQRRDEQRKKAIASVEAYLSKLRRKTKEKK